MRHTRLYVGRSFCFLLAAACMRGCRCCQATEDMLRGSTTVAWFFFFLVCAISSSRSIVVWGVLFRGFIEYVRFLIVVWFLFFYDAECCKSKKKN